jgi:hypothetical protein
LTYDEYQQLQANIAADKKAQELAIRLEDPEFELFYNQDDEPKDEILTFENVYKYLLTEDSAYLESEARKEFGKA